MFHSPLMLAAFALLVCTCLTSVAVAADSPTPLTQKYIDVFSSERGHDAELHALNQLQWSGLSDERLFDLIEQRLLALYPTARGKDVELASWYAKTLGTSGQDKYEETLQSIVSSGANSKIRKYANEGLSKLAQYAEWNPIISNLEGVEVDKPEQTVAFANMLRSDVWELRNMAAKRIYADQYYDSWLLDVLSQSLLSEYKNDYGSRYQDQTVAWMARALASSRMPAYQATLEEVAANATGSKLRSYARKYLNKYY